MASLLSQGTVPNCSQMSCEHATKILAFSLLTLKILFNLRSSEFINIYFIALSLSIHIYLYEQTENSTAVKEFSSP